MVLEKESERKVGRGWETGKPSEATEQSWTMFMSHVGEVPAVGERLGLHVVVPTRTLEEYSHIYH